MEEKKMMPCSFIAGILFALLALWSLIFGRLYSGTNLFEFAAYAAFATLLFLRKREKYALIPCAVLTLLMTIIFILGLTNHEYYIVTKMIEVGNKSRTYYEFSVYAMICRLLLPVAYACLLGIMVKTFRSQPQEKKIKIWFLPAALLGVRTLLNIIGKQIGLTYFNLEGGWRFAYYNEELLLVDLVTATALAFAALWVVYPERDKNIMSSGKATAKPMGTNSAAGAVGTTSGVSVVNDEAYCDLIKHVLLLLFTFGVWYFIWIYRMTGYTNTVRGEEERDPTKKLLLCLFVPFYSIYWTYKTAQRVDKIAAEKNATSDLATLCLVLDIFVPIIPPILMQDKINKVITAGDVQKESKTVRSEAKKEETEVGSADEIKKFKELLDTGAITQEEFDAKKKQLLGL